MKAKTRYVLYGITTMICLFVFSVFYAIYLRNQTIEDTIEDYPFRDSDGIIYNINSVCMEEDVLILKGWAIQPGIQYPYYNYGLDYHGKGAYNFFAVACKLPEERIAIFPTQLYREEVPVEENDEIDYGYCGFISRIPQKYWSYISKEGLFFCFRNPSGTWIRYPVKPGEVVFNNE